MEQKFLALEEKALSWENLLESHVALFPRSCKKYYKAK